MQIPNTSEPLLPKQRRKIHRCLPSWIPNVMLSQTRMRSSGWLDFESNLYLTEKLKSEHSFFISHSFHGITFDSKLKSELFCTIVPHFHDFVLSVPILFLFLLPSVSERSDTTRKHGEWNATPTVQDNFADAKCLDLLVRGFPLRPLEHALRVRLSLASLVCFDC